uniref:Uncharacterized protein n=1 Tax=Oryza sativa subsp. japonica TaxID=39947 RepID=Q8H576_ORYSJ|nr:hypothetical protein [Oryza sativa Japonica Group]
MEGAPTSRRPTAAAAVARSSAPRPLLHGQRSPSEAAGESKGGSAPPLSLRGEAASSSELVADAELLSPYSDEEEGRTAD